MAANYPPFTKAIRLDTGDKVPEDVREKEKETNSLEKVQRKEGNGPKTSRSLDMQVTPPCKTTLSTSEHANNTSITTTKHPHTATNLPSSVPPTKSRDESKELSESTPTKSEVQSKPSMTTLQFQFEQPVKLRQGPPSKHWKHPPPTPTVTEPNTEAYADQLSPPESAVNVFVVGDVGAGKSTLTAALKKEDEGFSRLTSRLVQVSGVEQRTAGIIPHKIASRKLGRLTLYDLAGHKTYYASHDALLRSTMTASSAAVFLLVADLAKSDEEFRVTILYWLTFTDNLCTSTGAKPHVIVIGSHADVVSSKVQKDKKAIVDSLASGPAFSGFYLAGFVSMDCRYSVSSSMSEIRERLAESCKSLGDSNKITFLSHWFLVYLLDEFRDLPAVSLSNVFSHIQQYSGKDEKKLVVIMNTMSDLQHACEELSERGNILFLKNQENPQNSWLVLNQEALLSHITGSVFAPEDFKQHHKLASSTGVVSLSNMATHFPKFDPNMLAHFFTHLEFCYEVRDREVLKLLAAGDPSSQERHFFFPSLIQIEASSIVWETSDEFDYHCGWLLQCSQTKQFFIPRFHHVLLLRLAFSFTLSADTRDVSSDLPTLKRKCTVWKNGISWANRSGVEVVVEVVESRVTMVLRCLKGHEMECVRLRSALIQKMVQAKEEFCPKVSVIESFIHPSDAIQYPPKPVPELKLFSLAEVANTVVSAEPCIVGAHGPPLPLEELLHFEPYANLGELILRELFDEQNPKYKMEVKDEFLYRVADQVRQKMDRFIELFKLPPTSLYENLHQAPPGPTHKLVRVFQLWRLRSEGTYHCLRRELDQFSVFAGRNPLQVLSELEPEASELFTEAMKKGHVEAGLIVCLLIGAAGSGKSHFKQLALKLLPPLLRVSTPLAEAPVRAISILRVAVENTDDDDWQLVNSKEMLEMLADAIKSQELLQDADDIDDTTSQDSSVQEVETNNSADLQAEDSSGEELSTVPGEHNLSQPKSSQTEKSSEVSAQSFATSLSQELVTEIEEEFIGLINKSSGSRKLLDVDWVYLTDSGGQPQFHEILSVFLPNASSITFVTKLNEQLKDHSTVEYYGEDGKPCGLPYQSLLSHEQLLRHVIQPISSRQATSSLADTQTDPKVFIVGTHKDLEHNCPESRMEKNAKLLDMLRPIFHDNLVLYRMAVPEQLIFPVNAKTPTEDDCKVAKEFRRAVTKMCSKVKVPIPLSWFALEELTRKLAEKKGVGVISTDECRQLAQRLHMKEDAFQAAVQYLVKLNLLLHYPQYLPNVIFTTSQVLLDKISALVKLTHCLRGKAEPPHANLQGCRSGHWLRFRDHGILTIEFLSEFPEHFVERLFTPNDFIELLTKLLLVAPFSDCEHFMPCLLPELSNEELDLHRTRLDPSPLAPLVVVCPDKWLPRGVFTLLIAYLQSSARWQVLARKGKPSCLYRNCISFKIPGYPGVVTLIDMLEHMEVHYKTHSAHGTVCTQIQRDVFDGLEKASHTLRCKDIQFERAFLCLEQSERCSKEPHSASFYQSHGTWCCNTNEEVEGTLTAQHTAWLDSYPPSQGHETKSKCELKPTNVVPICDILRDCGFSPADWDKLAPRLCGEIDVKTIERTHRYPELSLQETIRQWLHKDVDASWQKLATSVGRIGDYGDVVTQNILRKAGESASM